MRTTKGISAPFPLDVPWTRLTRDQRERVKIMMDLLGVKSVNGASGFHANLRQLDRKRQMIENGEPQ